MEEKRTHTNPLSEEAIEQLRKNPNVKSVSCSTVKFTPEFKAFFYKERQAGKTTKEIFLSAGLDPRLFGKSRSWQDEQEYRIVINDYMGVIRKPEDQRLYYDFHDLSGIIFGLRTPNTKKTQIIKIIQKKCRETCRADFHFYQAVYDAGHDKMSYEEIHITA